MERLFDPEQLITCPYNPAHHIMRKRMNTHLTKCKKSYPESKMVECDFNVNHKIPQPELQYHHETCPDRGKIENTIYQEEGADLNKFPIPNIEVESEECWDDSNAQPYNPTEYCEKSYVLSHMDVAPAKQKKIFREQQRQKFREISNRPVQQSQEQPRVSKSVPAPQRNLPEKPTGAIAEVTPESITDLTQRIQLGKNKSYIPKQN